MTRTVSVSRRYGPVLCSWFAPGDSGLSEEGVGSVRSHDSRWLGRALGAGLGCVGLLLVGVLGGADGNPPASPYTLPSSSAALDGSPLPGPHDA